MIKKYQIGLVFVLIIFSALANASKTSTKENKEKKVLVTFQRTLTSTELKTLVKAAKLRLHYRLQSAPSSYIFSAPLASLSKSMGKLHQEKLLVKSYFLNHSPLYFPSCDDPGGNCSPESKTQINLKNFEEISGHLNQDNKAECSKKFLERTDGLADAYDWGAIAIGSDLVQQLAKSNKSLAQEKILGVMDSGLDKNFISRTPGPGEDKVGHGTHVSGTIVNNAVNAKIRMEAVRFSDQLGFQPSDLLQQLDDFTMNGGVHVINLSIGGGEIDSQGKNPFISIFNAGERKKIVFVKASGNNNNEIETAYINHPAVILVNAVNPALTRANFANTSSGITLAAPGVDILSDLSQSAPPKGKLQNLKNGRRGVFASGTSMAAPHVTAVVGDIQSILPNISSSEVKDLLMLTALPLKVENRQTTGSGLVNHYGAIRFAEYLSQLPLEKQHPTTDTFKDFRLSIDQEKKQNRREALALNRDLSAVSCEDVISNINKARTALMLDTNDEELWRALYHGYLSLGLNGLALGALNQDGQKKEEQEETLDAVMKDFDRKLNVHTDILLGMKRNFNLSTDKYSLQIYSSMNEEEINEFDKKFPQLEVQKTSLTSKQLTILFNQLTLMKNGRELSKDEMSELKESIHKLNLPEMKKIFLAFLDGPEKLSFDIQERIFEQFLYQLKDFPESRETLERWFLNHVSIGSGKDFDKFIELMSYSKLAKNPSADFLKKLKNLFDNPPHLKAKFALGIVLLKTEDPLYLKDLVDGLGVMKDLEGNFLTTYIFNIAKLSPKEVTMPLVQLILRDKENEDKYYIEGNLRHTLKLIGDNDAVDSAIVQMIQSAQNKKSLYYANQWLRNLQLRNSTKAKLWIEDLFKQKEKKLEDLGFDNHLLMEIRMKSFTQGDIAESALIETIKAFQNGKGFDTFLSNATYEKDPIWLKNWAVIAEKITRSHPEFAINHSRSVRLIFMYAQVGLSDKSAALLEQCLINLIKSLPTTRGEWDNDYREWTRDVSWLLQTLLVLKNTHNLMPMSPSILQQWKNLRDLLPKSLLETYSLVKLTD